MLSSGCTCWKSQRQPRTGNFKGVVDQAVGVVHVCHVVFGPGRVGFKNLDMMFGKLFRNIFESRASEWHHSGAAAIAKMGRPQTESR